MQLAISTIGFVALTCAVGVATVASLPVDNAVMAGVLLVVWMFGPRLSMGGRKSGEPEKF